MFPTTITNDEINELELQQYEGKIIVVSEENKIKKALDEIRKQRVVGFDTETKPSFKKGVRHDVSLMQVAVEKKVFLFRINYTGITHEMAEFLADENIKKIGVALRDDIKDLRMMKDFIPGGFVEFSHLVKDVGIESNGLRKLTAIILGFRISKSAQTSNWENETLTEKQLTYAATDAWVCLQMYKTLHKKGYIS
jgi:ribonuclease D